MIGRVAAVMMAAAAAATALSAQPQAARTVWDGVYAAPQARRGEQVFKSECSYCHRDDLSGGFFDGGALPAPALAGPRAFGSSFVERWKDLSVGEMVATIASTMPQQKPSSLTLQQYVDVVSYLFERNDVPAGPSELAVDVATLGEILITAKR
jgi:cytochrome c